MARRLFESGGVLDIPKGKPAPKTGRKNAKRDGTSRAQKEGGKSIYFGLERLARVRARAEAIEGGNISAYVCSAVDCGVELGLVRLERLRALANRIGKSPGAIVDELIEQAQRKAGSR